MDVNPYEPSSVESKPTPAKPWVGAPSWKLVQEQNMGRFATSGAILFAIAVPHVLPCAEAHGADDQEYIEQLHSRMSRYSIVLHGDIESKLELRRQPILKWANPLRGIRGGAMFVWVSGVRPMAVGTVFLQKDGPHYELHSLSDSAVVGHYEARRIWYPKQPGLRFIELPDAGKPGDSATIRLQQMKNVARQFTATTENVRRPSEGRDQLRLLSRPIYRYADVDAGVEDGAIFAFTQGTDPDVILVLEVVSGTPFATWRAAFARLAFNQLEVRRKEAVVWSAPQLRKTTPEGVHFSWIDRTKPAD